MSAPQLTVQIQGRSSVSADNLNTFEQTCDDAAELRNFVGTIGVQVFMRGTASPGDGGQGVFYWNPSGVGPDDNGVTSIVPPAAASGCWTRLTGGPTGGGVTSVGLALPAIFTVTGSPVTGSGTLTATLNTQPANYGFMGPVSGSAAVPVFRALVSADLPVATTSAVGAVQPDGTSITITSDGIITAVGGGGGAVSSVSGDGATITVSPTTGATVVSLKSQVGLTILGNAAATPAVPSALNQASLSKIVGVFDQVGIASATTTDIGTCQSNNVQVTGTTTITSLGSSASVNNSLYFVQFTGALTLTNNNTSLALPGAANIKTAAGDFGIFLYTGSGNWTCLAYERETGRPIAPFGQEVPIASATTTDLGTASSNLVNITGTTTITSLGSSASLSNPIYNVKFSGILALTYNATSLILPGAGTITTAAGDTAVFEYLGSGNWFCREYYLASGEALVASGSGGGTVTSIATNNGLTGGTITTTGTIGLATISNGEILANYTGGTHVPVATSLATILNTSIGTDTGSLLAYSGTAWSELQPSSAAGTIFTSNGTGVVPTYKNTISISGSITAAGFVSTTASTAFSAGSGTYTTGLDLSGATLTNAILLPNAKSIAWYLTTSGTAGIALDSSNNLDIGTNANGILLEVPTTSVGAISPSANNTYPFGSSGDQWSNIYSVLGTFSGAVTAAGTITGNATGGGATAFYTNATNLYGFLQNASSSGAAFIAAGGGGAVLIGTGTYTSGIDLSGATLTNGIILPNDKSLTWSKVGGGTAGLLLDGSNNLQIGVSAGKTFANTTFDPASTNTYALGESSAAWASGYITGGVWTGSDRRLKHDISDSDLGLEFVLRTRPVSYYWDDPSIGVGKRYGFLAQELECALEGREFGGLDRPANDDDRYNLIYPELIAPLYKAVQELNAKIERMAA